MNLVPFEQRNFKPKRLDVHTHIRLTPRVAICLITMPDDADAGEWIKQQYDELTELIKLAESSAQANPPSPDPPAT